MTYIKIPLSILWMLIILIMFLVFLIIMLSTEFYSFYQFKLILKMCIYDLYCYIKEIQVWNYLRSFL